MYLKPILVDQGLFGSKNTHIPVQRSSTCLNRGIDLSKPFVAPDSGVDSSKSFSFESSLSKSSESSSQVLPDSTLSMPKSSSGDNPSSESPYLEDT